MTLPTPDQRARGQAPLAFLCFLALMTSVVAMTIDAVLPALDSISADLGFADANDRQLVIFAVFVGMGLSQPVFGILSDSLGRRPAALAGWALFLAGAALCIAAESAEAMLLGRFLQGLGAGGPRIVAIAIVRDLYAGRPMARMLSTVMTVFMLVPMFAPLVGQGIEALAGWRAIFGVYVAMAAVAALWYALGVPETLPAAARRPLRFWPLARALIEIVGSRVAMAHAAAAVCVFAPFMMFLATSQQVLEEVYGLGAYFPLAFGSLAVVFAAGSFASSRLVMALGMRRLAVAGLGVITGTSALTLALMLSGALSAVPPLPVFMGLMAVIFACIAFLIGNLNALALEPLGHVAGTAAAVVQSMASLGAAPVGFLIAQHFDGTVLPMVAGFVGLGLAGLGCLALGRTGRA